MSFRQPVDEAVLHGVLSHYSFYEGRIDSVTPQRSISGNGIVKVSIGSQSWALKRHDKRFPMPLLERSHWFQQRLIDGGVPVPRIVETTDRGTLVEVESAFFSVSDWVEGEHIQYAREPIATSAIESMAKNLAQLHTVGQSALSELPVPSFHEDILRSPVRNVARIKEAKSWGLPRMALLRLKPRMTAYDRWVLRAFDALAPRAQRLLELDASRFDDPCFVHGDIWWGNLIFDGSGRLSAFLDFDMFQVSSRAYEVGCAAAMCATSVGNVETFVDTYETAAQSTVDRDLLLLSMMIRITGASLWCVHARVNLPLVDRAWLEEWSYFLSDCFACTEQLMERA